MENLVLSINIVLPLFLCCLLGFFLRVVNLVDELVLRKMNALCFKVFLPIHLFNSIIATDLAMAIDRRLITFCVCGILGLAFVAMIVIPLIEKENPRRGVMVNAVYRSNFVLFALPMATALCGEARLGPTSMLICIIIPLYNVLSVVVLEWFRGGKPNFRKVLKGIIKNPLIIASVLAIVMNLLKVPIPTPINSALKDLGRAATPLALVMLGGEFAFSKLHGATRQLIITAVSRLIFVPMIMITLGAFLGFRDEFLVPILLVFGAPTAVSTFTMAQQMDGDSTLAASIVVFTSAFSILTMFLEIFVLKQLGFI